MTLQKAMEMIAPFEGLPHYSEAREVLWIAAGHGPKVLHGAAYRVRDAFASYQYAVNYGKADA